jgi:hypothetical protein
MSTGHYPIHFTYSLKKERENRKDWRRSGRQARANSRDNCIFTNVKNRGKGRPLPRAVSELQRRRDMSGDDKHLGVASHRSDGKPLGVTATVCLYKPAARDSGPL